MPSLDSKTHKLLVLAFDPAAPEGEAVNAFLASRRRVTGFTQVFTVNDSPAPTAAASPRMFTATWEVTLSPKNLDVFMHLLNSFSDTIYYRLSSTQQRHLLTDIHKLVFKVQFPTQRELTEFQRYFNRGWDLITSS